MTVQLQLSIFISYSHDSDEHRQRVLGLSERLRADGIETILDRYVESGSPPEGWPRWMLNALDKATHVVCVCTETYYRRFRGREVPGKGKGVDWEGALMTQSLYDARSVSTKCIPVLFARTDEPCIPEPLRGQTFHVMDSDAGYEALYDALLNQSGVVPGPVGTPKRKPRATGQPLSFPSVPPTAEAKDRTPDVTRKIAGTQLEKHAPRVLFGRETELAALDATWANGTLNIYTLVAWGGAGKTSLVFHWVQTRFAAKGWPGVERYFDWSFYSQGTGESRQTSADLFIAKALAFFGDPDPTVGGPHERGERLAGLIRQHRTLLILDGIEPLQYPPNDPQAGRLKDQALEALLRELAADNAGLVVITTREHLTNVEGYATTEEQKLDKLAKEAAVALLRHLQIVGTDEELHAAWKDAGGHALTLSLLGRFIADAYEDRDIRHYREVRFEAADQEHQGRSAFKVMIAYERWLKSGGPDRQRELAVLRLTGLFDRPMAKRCLQALRAEPAIPGLTDALVTLTPQQWNIAVTRLSQVDLLSVSADAIDAHPLIREYFAAQLKRDQPEAFQAAHSRLFDYLCENTPHRPDGIDGLAPLYEAVTHGCLAGRHQEACDKVYVDRILRGTDNDGFYSSRKLGTIGADLAAVATFFDAPWHQVSPNLIEGFEAWVLAVAAFNLRALGRLTEALQPMRAGLELGVKHKNWKAAAIRASNLSELEVTLGRLPDAVTDARQSITHADQSGDAFELMSNRTTAADALYQSGQRMEAGILFAEAERLQQDRQPEFDLLYSLWGFRYCDWLLAPAAQAAWQQLLNQPLSNSKSQISDGLADVERRATMTLRWATDAAVDLLSAALDHLTLARVGLIRAILANTLPQPRLDLPHVAAAVNGLRATGSMHHLPLGLLTASLYHFVRGEHALALKHLAEAQQIAERGPMPLFLADIHLTRARLAGSLREEGGMMNVDAKAELAQAAQLIRDLGYGRRYEELVDAEKAIATTPAQRPGHVDGSLTRTSHQSPLAERKASMSTTKTVLELDLVGYSDKARELEEHLGVELVMRFNDQIKEFISNGLTSAGVAEQDAIVQSTGDGAIVVLDTPEQAHRLAEAVNTAVTKHNLTRTAESARRWFRIAAATGEIEIRGKDLAGTTIANSVRLESAGEAGHFLVDLPTWNALPAQLQSKYLPVEEIRGKRDELIPARRCVFNSAPRPDHVELTLKLTRAEFTELAAKSFLRELKRLLDCEELAVTLEGIREGSTVVRLRFRDSNALGDFIRRHSNDDSGLQAFFEQWSIESVSYHARVKATGQNQPDAKKQDIRINEDDFLAELTKLPGPWFKQLVFKFDKNNAVSDSGAQSDRAIELLNVLRVIDPGLCNAAAEIKRLKGPH
ncbi:MAG: SEFIR domain-containing protein [Lysobacteraceae bacterium]